MPQRICQSNAFHAHQTGMAVVISFFMAFLAFGGVATAQNPVPFINQPLVPDAVKPGGAEFTLTVNGTGFVPGSVVRWNGSMRKTMVVSKMRLTATITASDIAKARTAVITVLNPSPGGGKSNTVFFEVTLPTPSIALAKAEFLDIGANATSVAVGDFNDDGHLDLAVANENSSSIKVLLGRGDGTFNAPMHYGVGSGSESVAVGDFNDDGKPDLAVADVDSGNVSVLLGNGDGTFKASMHYGAGSVPYSVVVGDFNADGKLDLAVTNNGSSNVSVLLGNGDGTFQAAVDYTVGLTPTELAVGDFNRDGKPDLVVSSGGNGVSILLGIGDGTFRAGATYAAGRGPLAVGDFNGDGKLDLAIVSDVVRILLGNGDGTFRAPVTYAVPSGPLAVGDFNGDRKLDLAVGSNVLLGNGDGTFEPPTHFSLGLDDPRSVAIGDFNGDGRLEIAVAEYIGKAGVVLQIPIISLSRTDLRFTDQLVGSTSPTQTVTVSNSSGLRVNFGSIAVTGTNAADFSQTQTCSSTLAPEAQCTLRVAFKPTKIGPRTATVTLTDNGSGSPQSIKLSGIGVISGPNATLAPASLTFAPQLLNTASASKSVKLANYGTMPLDIAGFAKSGDFAEMNTCRSSVAAGASCTISVDFKPAQTGTRTGTLSIADNAPGSPQTVPLRGAGTVVKLVPASLNFGTLQQCKQATQTATLTNTGGTALSISAITLTGAHVFAQTNNCGAIVGAGQSCTVTVTFTTGFGVAAGTYKGALVITDNGGGGSETLPLLGTVVLCHLCCF
jgi:FG-GAP-like repeat/Abnormal spindle-like microcephaly-assoc'd, ASPM-SPD-2-Hydin